MSVFKLDADNCHVEKLPNESNTHSEEILYFAPKCPF